MSTETSSNLQKKSQKIVIKRRQWHSIQTIKCSSLPKEKCFRREKKERTFIGSIVPRRLVKRVPTIDFRQSGLK